MIWIVITAVPCILILAAVLYVSLTAYQPETPPTPNSDKSTERK